MDYPEAIRSMRRYLQARPDASDVPAAKGAIVKWELALEQEKIPKSLPACQATWIRERREIFSISYPCFGSSSGSGR